MRLLQASYPRLKPLGRIGAIDPRVSTRTIYDLARKGKIPAMRVGREWRFARRNLVDWVANSSKTDQLTAALGNGRVVPKRR